MRRAQYSDPDLRAWSDAVRQYERGHVYLAEAARQLSQSVNFDMCASLLPGPCCALAATEPRAAALR